MLSSSLMMMTMTIVVVVVVVVAVLRLELTVITVCLSRILNIIIIKTGEYVKMRFSTF